MNRKEYSRVRQEFQTTLRESIKLSREYTGIQSPTAQHFHASVLFTRLCVQSTSIEALSPRLKSKPSNSVWDYMSVVSLTRNLLECYIVYFYLCIDECLPDEWNARWNLLNLHDHCTRRRLNLISEDEGRSVQEDLTDRLVNNTWFQQLSEKQRKAYLAGNNAMFLNKYDVITRSGEDKEKFEFFYNLSSQKAHSMPMAFYRMAEDGRGCGVECDIEIGYTGICLGICDKYLAKANEQFLELWSFV